MNKLFLTILNYSLLIIHCSAQPLNQKEKFTHQDTLRGTIGPEREWWDVLHYDLHVTPDYDAKSITGETTIQYKIVKDKHTDYMQIDLQQPLKIDTIYYDGKLYINYPKKPYYNEGNVWHVPLPNAARNSIHTITIIYHGNPRIAVNPPWKGGWTFTKDAMGRPWMTVTCQGLGASVWYPCKDHQSDEPDSGATLTITVPDSLIAVGNGRLISKSDYSSVKLKIDSVQKKLVVEDSVRLSDYTWEVTAPINNYNIIPYIGKYVTWHEDYNGEKGKLDCDYWVLDYDLEKAKRQFTQVDDMLKCFEYWMGPYPFYEDGYKLVETPHLGMEHQSAVAYGNKFMNGYLGRDLSASGWGLKWDYIIVHESGHEWFANNITSNDIADMWVHEGITDYTETLFVECQSGKEAADAYTQGLRRTIRNDRPIIGIYGVNQEGSGDMYNKGNNIMHMVRQIIDNDSLFRNILRGLNETFYHKTVDSKDIENYIIQKSGKDLSKLFDQYLRTTKIPTLEYKIQGDKLSYHWANCIDGFNMPVKLANSKEWLKPTTEWKETRAMSHMKDDLQIDKNFYITVKKL
jgi:aminopeptidase N